MPQDFKRFEGMSREERTAWRSHVGTQAVRALIQDIGYQEQQAMMAAVEKGEDGKRFVGGVRMAERLLREVFTETPDDTAASHESDDGPLADDVLGAAS